MKNVREKVGSEMVRVTVKYIVIYRVVYLIESFGDKNRSVVVAYVRVGALLIGD